MLAKLTNGICCVPEQSRDYQARSSTFSKAAIITFLVVLALAALTITNAFTNFAGNSATNGFLYGTIGAAVINLMILCCKRRLDTRISKLAPEEEQSGTDRKQRTGSTGTEQQQPDPSLAQRSDTVGGGGDQSIS